MDKKIAIVGGSGFLGSSLVRKLNKTKEKFVVFDKVPSDETDSFIEIDVEDPYSLYQLKDCNIIINLAAVHRDDIKPISKYDDVNVQGAINICKAASNYGINKIIFTSSVAIYGFAPKNTGEDGEPNYFNDYGRTKFLAEQVYKEWQSQNSDKRSLTIIRPTVIFGEGNRGNVYNLLKSINSGRFFMIGNGKNIKSIAYVENVSSCLMFFFDAKPGIHIYNYIDKPDISMNKLISTVRNILFKKNNVGLRLPVFLGLIIGKAADVVAFLLKINLPVSSIRVKKFLATTQFNSSIYNTNFKPDYSLQDGLEKTIKYEFIENNAHKKTFDTE